MTIAVALTIIMVPIVAADFSGPECVGGRHTIKVIPVGSQYTGEPLVTGSPADLMIFHTGNGPITDVWLLIVLNEPTHHALSKITIDGSTFLVAADFTLVDKQWIPPVLPNSTTGYPGSCCLYNVAAVKDKMDEKGNPIYYAVKSFLPQITTKPTNFTLAVELNSPANLKALILALGKYYPSDSNSFDGLNCIRYKPFNVCSSFSKSTLVVPEAATLALTIAPFLGFAGLYLSRKRKM